MVAVFLLLFILFHPKCKPDVRGDADVHNLIHERFSLRSLIRMVLFCQGNIDFKSMFLALTYRRTSFYKMWNRKKLILVRLNQCRFMLTDFARKVGDWFPVCCSQRDEMVKATLMYKLARMTSLSSWCLPISLILALRSNAAVLLMFVAVFCLIAHSIR